MLLNQPGNGRHIAGELYELDETMLARIDGLESIGQPGNLRITVRVSDMSGGSEREAFAYAKAPQLATLIHSGYLDDYQDRRFIPPWERIPTDRADMVFGAVRRGTITDAPRVRSRPSP